MSTPKGVYQWVVMPMNFKNAPSIFQRMMDHLLEDIILANPYIDDIIIGSKGDTLQDLLEITKGM